jgi:hypothetical protein
MDKTEDQDKVIICCDCSGTFIWEKGEQEFYCDKGYTAPRRCPGCRRELKRKRREDEQRARGVQHGK